MTPPGRSSGSKRVLVVDDSAAIRSLLRATIDTDPRLEVVGEARDPYEARDLIKALDPDVITLDVEMPRMNGLDFLERLMRLRPTPVVVVSTRTRDKSAEAVRALALGAVDCVDVSRLQVEAGVRRRLLATLVAAGGARVGGTGAARPATAAPRPAPFRWNGCAVFIGSSTGGVDALERVISQFPADCPPTLIAQHMPAPFLDSFAGRLDALYAPDVAIARGDEGLRPGRILLAGGGTHHLAVTGPAPVRTVLLPAEETDLHVPAVDRLFRSATVFGRRAVGVILTGMGRDGAEGLRAMRAAGARTLGQTGESCVIDGMPRAAREAGAVERDVGLDRMGIEILRLCSKMEVQST
jgi:two-component system chemotaxis response regulator CheB